MFCLMLFRSRSGSFSQLLHMHVGVPTLSNDTVRTLPCYIPGGMPVLVPGRSVSVAAKKKKTTLLAVLFCCWQLRCRQTCQPLGPTRK